MVKQLWQLGLNPNGAKTSQVEALMYKPYKVKKSIAKKLIRDVNLGFKSPAGLRQRAQNVLRKSTQAQFYKKHIEYDKAHMRYDMKHLDNIYAKDKRYRWPVGPPPHKVTLQGVRDGTVIPPVYQDMQRYAVDEKLKLLPTVWPKYGKQKRNITQARREELKGRMEKYNKQKKEEAKYGKDEFERFLGISQAIRQKKLGISAPAPSRIPAALQNRAVNVDKLNASQLASANRQAQKAVNAIAKAEQRAVNSKIDLINKEQKAQAKLGSILQQLESKPAVSFADQVKKQNIMTGIINHLEQPSEEFKQVLAGAHHAQKVNDVAAAHAGLNRVDKISDAAYDKALTNQYHKEFKNKMIAQATGLIPMDEGPQMIPSKWGPAVIEQIQMKDLGDDDLRRMREVEVNNKKNAEERLYAQKRRYGSVLKHFVKKYKQRHLEDMKKGVLNMSREEEGRPRAENFKLNPGDLLNMSVGGRGGGIYQRTRKRQQKIQNLVV